MTVSFPEHFDPEAPCPNCGSRGLEAFYRIERIPVHSCLLMPTREAALDYPCGDLELGFCPSCGFVTNTLFDQGMNEYSDQYEETQGFSPTFTEFAENLAQHVVDTYDVRGKDVLEIGCGKGEFLVLLAQLGNNRGVGIDPSIVPERVPPEFRDSVRFIPELYGEQHLEIAADLVCCRHTLEHIAPTGEFMELVCRGLDREREPVVFFELPDVLRVLEEGAFWDIYYEHCSYFSAGSLARLFRAHGLGLTELRLDYDDQYLIIGGVPGAERGTTFALEDDLARLQSAVSAFRERCAGAVDGWRQRIRGMRDAGERVVVWGGGSKGVAFLTTVRPGDVIEYAVDINPYKQGKFMPTTGQEVVSPEFLTEYRPQHVIVMNPIYRDEIQRDLERLGVAAQVHAV